MTLFNSTDKDPDLQISWPEGESSLMGNKKSSFFIHSFSKDEQILNNLVEP